MSTARITEFHNGALRFDVADHGPADGEKVVLLHGFPQTASAWQPVAHILADEGFRTFAPTLRGYAKNARPRGRFAYRATALADDLSALIDQIGGGPVHLVGHDWGATVAWTAATTRPHLFTTLTTVSVPHSAAFLRAMLTSGQLPRVYYMALFQLPWLPELVFRAFPALATGVLANAGMSEADLQRFESEVRRAGALTPSLNYYRAMMFTRPNSLWAKVDIPTTHVWGSDDRAINHRSTRLCEKYVRGDYRLEIIDGASHWIPTQNANELATIITDRIRWTSNQHPHD